MENEKKMEKPKEWGRGVRLTLVTLAVVVIFYNSITNLTTVKVDVPIITELTPEFFDKANDFLRSNSRIRNILMILNGLFQDFCFLSFVYVWVMYSKNWRQVISVVLLVFLKLFCQYIFEMKPKDDQIWNWPGFPSLIITYNYSFNYFFAAVVSLNLIQFFEFRKLEMRKMAIFSILAMLYYIGIMLALKAQYLLSIIGGLLCGHYLFICGDKLKDLPNYVYKLDNDETVRKLSKQTSIKTNFEEETESKSQISRKSDAEQVKYGRISTSMCE